MTPASATMAGNIVTFDPVIRVSMRARSVVVAILIFDAGDVRLGRDAFGDRVADGFGLAFVDSDFLEQADVGQRVEAGCGCGHGHAPEAMSARRHPQARIVHDVLFPAIPKRPVPRAK